METIIKKELICWARKKAVLTQNELAQKMHVSLEVVALWEKGEKSITMSQAEKLANCAYVPFGFLFAEKPPEDKKLPIPDFRSINDQFVNVSSPELLEVIEDAQAKQDWYKEYLVNEGYENLSFVNSLTIAMNPVKAAEIIKNALKLKQHEYWVKRHTFEETLRFLIELAEEAGIIVIRNAAVKNNTHRGLSVEEFRGFVLCDEIAPLIFINGKDSKAAQIFTLVHEIVHVFLGKTGLLDADMIVSPNSPKVEKFCNQATAEFLTPKKEFLSVWNDHNEEDTNFDKTSKYFKVSRLVVISRAYQLKLIDWSTMTYYKKIEFEKIEHLKAKQKNSKGGPSFYKGLKFKVSQSIAGAVISEVNSGRLLYRDAFNILGVKNKNALNKLAAEIGAF